MALRTEMVERDEAPDVPAGFELHFTKKPLEYYIFVEGGLESLKGPYLSRPNAIMWSEILAKQAEQAAKDKPKRKPPSRGER